MFDLDGTLLNTIVSITHYVNKTLQKYGISPISEQDCKSFVGNGAKKLVDRTLVFRERYTEEFAEEFYRAYMAEYDADPLYLTHPYDGIPELIGKLRESGARLAVISNKQDASTVPVIKHFFGDAIDIVRGGREGFPLKPSPEVPLSILKELGVSPSECVYVGDSEVDMQTGKNMGAALTVGVSWGFRSFEVLVSSGADTVVGSVDELLKAVGL